MVGGRPGETPAAPSTTCESLLFTGVSSNGTYLAGLDTSDKPAIYNTSNGQTTEIAPAGGSVPNAWSVTAAAWPSGP